jgi:hypothetical protein
LTGKNPPEVPVGVLVMVDVVTDVMLQAVSARSYQGKATGTYVAVSTSVVPLAVTVSSCVWTEDMTVVRVESCSTVTVVVAPSIVFVDTGPDTPDGPSVIVTTVPPPDVDALTEPDTEPDDAEPEADADDVEPEVDADADPEADTEPGAPGFN